MANKSLQQVISDRRRALQNQYAYIAELEELQELRASRKASENPYMHAEELDKLSTVVARFDGIQVSQSTQRLARRLSDDEIESVARDLQVKIWERRSQLFPDSMSMDPLDMLDPAAAFRLLGYSVQVADALGQFPGLGHPIRVAGLIDKATKQVLLSSAFPQAVRNFTAAHELGHAALHEFSGMHRDKPVDGSMGNRDPQEREADKFAAFFLMPRKLLKARFESIFGASPFELTDDTGFALFGTEERNRRELTSLRNLTRLLSSTPRFNGRPLVPLATQFRVSYEAMAIRLEQLSFVRWTNG